MVCRFRTVLKRDKTLYYTVSDDMNTLVSQLKHIHIVSYFVSEIRGIVERNDISGGIFWGLNVLVTETRSTTSREGCGMRRGHFFPSQVGDCGESS